ASPSTLSSGAITQIWQRVSEDYRPFDVNVTTEESKFNAANPNLRMRIVITTSSSWYPNNVGGVAYLNSFSWGGNPDTPCWVFENKLGYNAKNVAEAASHEGGHTLSLKHQSVWNASCAKTAEYHSGIGSGVTSWAPIMGVGYSKNVTIWHNGPNSTTCTTLQYDHGGNAITGALFLNYRVDDVGNNYATAKNLILNTALVKDTGLITTNADVDAYKFDLCNSRYVTIDVKPWGMDTVNYSGANLDVRLTLFNAVTSNSIAIDPPITQLNARLGANLTSGSYYFTIDGGGSANYSDYGSMGTYFNSVTSDNVPNIVSDFNSTGPYCTDQPISLSDNSFGGPTEWSWTLTGASPATSTLNNVQAIYNAAGIYTVSLNASSGTLTSCGITKTIQVVASPVLSVTSNPNTICNGETATLTANGANTYTWNSSVFSNTIASNPSSTSVLTASGTQNNCVSSTNFTLNVNPLPNVSATVSKAEICDGETATLNAGGAQSYTWSNSSTNQSITVSPSVTTVYTVTGTDVNGCTNSSTVQLVVSWCTFVKELNENNVFNVYPNPVQNELVIESINCEECEVTIYNTLGQEIKTTYLNSGRKSVDFSEFPKGVYEIVINEKKEIKFKGKVLKQ
ncbi:MAG: T9SS type A sorting domain-containing protein, partial [Bacteroidia bacterium]